MYIELLNKHSSTSDIAPIIAGVPQEAILSPLLFNICASDRSNKIALYSKMDLTL